jgi:hypothetical protein
MVGINSFEDAAFDIDFLLCYYLISEEQPNLILIIITLQTYLSKSKEL